jgi:hypothetical protein
VTARTPGSLRTWRRDAIRRLKASRQETLALVKRLPEPEIVRPRTLDEWSVKDVLGHLLACDEETVHRLSLIGRGRGDRIRWFESMADADRFNARTVARLRRVTLRAILGRMRRARADLIRRFQRLPAASLHDPSHAYPVTEWLPAPGWSHERDHAAEIKAWSARQPKPRARRPASRA